MRTELARKPSAGRSGLQISVDLSRIDCYRIGSSIAFGFAPQEGLQRPRFGVCFSLWHLISLLASLARSRSSLPRFPTQSPQNPQPVAHWSLHMRERNHATQPVTENAHDSRPAHGAGDSLLMIQGKVRIAARMPGRSNSKSLVRSVANSKSAVRSLLPSESASNWWKRRIVAAATAARWWKNAPYWRARFPMP